jgi:hypothetical protein
MKGRGFEIAECRLQIADFGMRNVQRKGTKKGGEEVNR